MDFNYGNKDQAVKACERYEELTGARSVKGYKRASQLLDLTAADGVNGNPEIDWDGLLASPAKDFLHDIGGISRHIDRQTGVIGDCFSVRYAKR